MTAHSKNLKRAIRDQLLPWFHAGQRSMPWRTNRTPYRVWISELMLQQTRVDQVIPYFNRFMERFPTLEILAAASQDDVLKQWEGLGYYTRARNLHKAAQMILTEHNGQFPDNAADIRKLPGIGSYTTAAIGSLAFNLDLAVLDGNVIRVLSRSYAYKKDTGTSAAKKELQLFADELLISGEAGDFNEALMELGATVCLPKNPNCPNCPIKPICKAEKEGKQTDYPIKKPRKKIPHITVGAAVISNSKNEVLIAQRKETAMLGGLWEFPGGKLEPDESIEECVIREIKEELGVHITTGDFLMTVKHAYSHFTMDMHTYHAKIVSGTLEAIDCADFKWVPIADLHQFAFSKADLKIIAKLRG